MLETNATTAVTPAAAASAASEALQLARHTAIAITEVTFRKSPIVAMALPRLA